MTIEVSQFLLVDEFQDLNACDLAVIRTFATRGAELFAAGDDDQSIYGFRFAAPEGIRTFVDQYPGSESLALQECRRCGVRILAAALFVAPQDPRRLPKVLRCPEGAPQGEVRLLRFDSEIDEAGGIAVICNALIRGHGISPREILVLLRSDRNSAFSTPIRQALAAAGIPAASENEPLAPLDTGRPGRQVLSILRLINNRLDSLAWNTLLRERQNGIGPTTPQRIYELARERGATFSEVLPDAPGVVGARAGRAEGGAEMDDARRLLYVSMTRARRFLFMTHCRQRVGVQRHTGSRAGQPARRLTPFLEGVPGVASQAWNAGEFGV